MVVPVRHARRGRLTASLRRVSNNKQDVPWPSEHRRDRHRRDRDTSGEPCPYPPACVVWVPAGGTAFPCPLALDGGGPLWGLSRPKSAGCHRRHGCQRRCTTGPFP
eukprot:5929969-Pyramimonas_sp.AAC.1